MFTLHDLADQVRQTAQQMSAGGYVVLGNRFVQAADLISSIANAGTDPEDIAPDQNELIRDLLNIGVSFGAGEWLAVRGMAATVAMANPVAGVVIFVGAAAFGTIVGSLLDYLHEEWGITLVGEEIDHSSVDAPVSILGTIMQDSFISTLHNDTVHGLAGDDILINAGGSDEVFGGWGSDTLDYSSRTDGVLVHIDGLIDGVGLERTYSVQHATGTDVVSSVETVIGTAAADEFDIRIGAGASTVELQGQGGDDGFTIRNAAGPSGNAVAVLNGGEGLDKLYIGDDASHTYVNLASNYAQYGMQNAVGSRFSIHEIECVLGNEGMDEIHGDDGENVLFGASGADSLFGGGADDFIFFDFADGSNVYGGSGRDVAVAIGQDGVTVDMAAQGLECVIGCDGADMITVGDGEGNLMVAGGGGADTIYVPYGNGEGTRILWGSDDSVADEFVFYGGGQLGLLVVTVAGLTTENFSTFDLSMLNLPATFNWGAIDAVIINPDSHDRFYGPSDTTSIFTEYFGIQSVDENLSGVEWDVVWDGYIEQTVQGSSGYLGASLHMQVPEYGSFVDIWYREKGDTATAWLNGAEHYDQGITDLIADLMDEYGNPVVDWSVDMTEFDEGGEGTGMLWFRDAEWTGGPDSHDQWFVAGGSIYDTEIVANGAPQAIMPVDPGPSPLDWLLAA